jgi:Bacterial Ig-like domain (group 2)
MALAACSGGDDPVDPGTPGAATTVNISVVTTTMVAGATQQLSAKLYDKNGRLVTSTSVSWSVLPQTVATISSTGLLTAVAPGSATVTASAGSITSTVEVIVTPDLCTTPVSLAVGEVKVVTGGAAVSCITLAATTGTSDFLIVGANTRPVQDDLLQYTLATAAAGTSALVAPVASALNAPEVQAQLDPRLLVQAQEAARVDGLHERLRSFERARLTDVVRQSARQRADVTLSRTAPSFAVAAAIAAVGDTVTIRVPNLAEGKDICRDFITVKGVVRAQSTRAVIVEDIASPSGGFTTTDYNQIASEFDTVIFPADTSWFGAPTDINNDGRITILYTPEVNKLTPSGSSGFTAGFFFGSDLIKKSEYPNTNDCRNQTNEQEIFYLLSPDPTGRFNNVRTTVTVRQGTRGVIAHEFQHMINQGVRQFNPAVQALETFWLNEALSHLAEEVTGRRLLSFGDFQRLRYSDVNPTPATPDNYNAWFRQNLSRLQRWMVRPDTSAAVSAQNRIQLAPRGASWALLRYTIDHYSSGSARAFTKALAAGPQTDVANLMARARGAQFEQIIAGWLIANYADGLGINGLAPRYGYLSWNMRDAMSGSNNGTFPLLVNALPGTVSTRALSSSGNYFRLQRTGASPAIQIRMQAPTGGSIASDYATVAILRAQ